MTFLGNDYHDICHLLWNGLAEDTAIMAAFAESRLWYMGIYHNNW